MTAPTFATLTSSMTVGGTGSASNKGIGRPRTVLQASVDVATAVANGLTTTQSIKLIQVPANTMVIMHQVWNATALSMGAGNSVSVGDSASTTQWVNANSTQTANTYATIANTSKAYTAADNINVTLTGGTLATGRIVVFYELIDLTEDSIAVVP